MRNRWLERILDSVADRGRDLLKLRNHARASIAEGCAALLSQQGEAAGLALSREVLQAYQGLDAGQKAEFFELLYREYGPDRARIRMAADAYLRTEGLEDFLGLSAAVEPPRQELLRRLNRAPCGTAALVAMRGDLLKLLKSRPHLKAVDADFRHLLASWFNRGFLRLERIDWHSPAQVLEKLIAYESVHEIRGWEDLRRRLAADRRCFAFFHPALPEEPLVFVEVALVQGMAERVQPLLDPGAPIGDPRAADTAMFYSINNTQDGLRGISFGNFLIKQVVAELSSEFPELERFATLSPMPRFAETLKAGLRDGSGPLDEETVAALLEEFAETLCERSGETGSVAALLALLKAPLAHQDVLVAPLQRLALAYLTAPHRQGRGLLDPVATFHLSNGARLERINAFANSSPHGLDVSFGVMVNYLYDPSEVEANHERFVGHGKITLSRPLARERKKLAPAAARG